MKNYSDREGCYPPSARLKTEMDNILPDLHNSSHRQLLLIQNICQFLTCLHPRRLFYFGLFLGMVSGYKKIFFHGDTAQKKNKIHRAIRFAQILNEYRLFNRELKLG